MSRYHTASALDGYHPIIRELVSGGWAEKQIRRDALTVWERGDEVFFSIGDWAKVPSSDVEAAVRRVLGDDAKVDWDFEAGPDGEGWKQVWPDAKHFKAHAEAYEIGDMELDWDGAQAAVFEVNTSQLDASRLKRDPKGGPSDWRYAGPVPPEAVELAYVDDYTDDIEPPDADYADDAGPPEPMASCWWRVAEQLGEDAGPVASFDFDDVLHYAPGGNPIDFWNWESYVPREPYLVELRRLASEGYRIIIVSHRDPGMEGPILQFAGRHGLPLDEVHCIGIPGSKREVLEDKGAVLHYDDSPYLAEELRDSDIKFVQVRQTGKRDLSWVPVEMWKQYPAYSHYADMVGADKPV